MIGLVGGVLVLVYGLRPRLLWPFLSWFLSCVRVGCGRGTRGLRGLGLRIRSFRPFLDRLFDEVGRFRHIRCARNGERCNTSFMLRDGNNFNSLRCAKVMIGMNAVERGGVRVRERVSRYFAVPEIFGGKGVRVGVGEITIIAGAGVAGGTRS